MDLEERLKLAERRADAIEHLIFAQELVLKITVNALLGAVEVIEPRDKGRADALREFMAAKIEKSIGRFPNEVARAVMLRSYVEWLRHSQTDDLPTPHSGGVLQ